MNQTAGRVIAKGNYGCVFSPSLDCESQQSTSSKVSKVVEKEFLDSEYKNILGFNLNKLDPDKDIFIYPDEPLCNLINFDIKRDLPNSCGNITREVGKINEYNKKNRIDEINKELTIINFNNGGSDLHKFKLTGTVANKKKQSENLFKSLLNLFYGIQLLSSNNIVHRDIKPMNIVFDGTNTRIIDFGLSLNYNSDTTSFNDTITKYEYRYWPIEYNLVHDIINNKLFKKSDKKPVKVSKIMKKISKLQKKGEYNVNTLRNVRADIIDITNLIIKNKINMKISDAEFYNDLYSKFDTYSLGIILDYIFFRSKYKGYASDSFKSSLKPIIEKMTLSSYIKRIDIKTAAIEYKTQLINNNLVSKEELESLERRFNIYFGE